MRDRREIIDADLAERPFSSRLHIPLTLEEWETLRPQFATLKLGRNTGQYERMSATKTCSPAQQRISARMDCWICGAPATTGEHKTKQSDLRAVLGKPTQAQPFYYHDKNVRNRPIGSYKGDFLKSPSRLCAPCNNQRTQPHDLAWEQMSDWLRKRMPPIRSGDFIRADRVYPTNATRELLNVQLYFTKLTGCHLVEVGAKFDQETLANSILTGKPNPYIHLKFGISRSGLLVGMSDLEVATLAADSSVAFAVWIYSLDAFVVHVMYAISGERRDGLVGAWHPRSGSNRFILADFP